MGLRSFLVIVREKVTSQCAPSDIMEKLWPLMVSEATYRAMGRWVCDGDRRSIDPLGLMELVERCAGFCVWTIQPLKSNLQN
jgi:hypothetical protein